MMSQDHSFRRSPRHFLQDCQLSQSLSITRDILCFCLQPCDKLSIPDFLSISGESHWKSSRPGAQGTGSEPEEIESRAAADQAGHARDTAVWFCSIHPFTAHVHLLQVLVSDCDVKWMKHITRFSGTDLSSKTRFDELGIIFTKPVFFVWRTS